MWKRNIITFSGEYADGALSVVSDEKEASAPDLLLSYHGNDHYNSVRPINGQKNGQSATMPQPPAKGRTKGKASVLGGDQVPAKQAENLGDAGRTRPPTRGGPCPCGSGLKYKKCCMVKAKVDKRLARHKERCGSTVELVERTSPNTKIAASDEKKDGDEFIGNFRVLSI